jgi:solute carrier family 25 (mitochondrial phosphate transporter), member 23/24/25/41
MITDLFIGGIGGIISRSAVAPIELNRLQMQNSFIPNSTLTDVYKKEGLRFFWKGNGTNCIRVFPQLSINYAVFRKTKKYSKKYIPNKNILNFSCGCIGGFTSMMITYPLETTRTYLSLQTNKNKYKGVIDALRKIPPRQLYQGCKMSMYGFGGFSGIQYTSYYYINRTLKDTSFDSKLFAGAFAGTFSVSITYPTDLIRRRLQLQGFDKSVPKYNGILDCCRKIFKTEGFPGFYRGLSATYLKTGPAIAIQFWTIETLNKYFKNQDI